MDRMIPANFELPHAVLCCCEMKSCSCQFRRLELESSSGRFIEPAEASAAADRVGTTNMNLLCNSQLPISRIY